MKILMVNSLYPPIVQGGAERSVSLLAEALVRRGDEVSVVTLHDREIVERQQIQGVSVYRLPLRNLYWPFGEGPRPSTSARLRWHLRDLNNVTSARDVADVIDEVQPDVVNTNNVNGFSCSIWDQVLARKIHLTHTARDYYLLCRRATLFRNGNSCTNPCLVCRSSSLLPRHQASGINHVIAISHFLLDLHRSRGFFPTVPSSVIYNLPGEAGPTPARIRTEYSPGLVFGFAGRLSPEKGIEVLLAATTQIPHSDWRLCIAGTGPPEYLQQLRTTYPDPRIEWLGFVVPADYHARIDVAIVPSLWQEPLGRTVFEAFAAGKSVLCSRSGGIPEICRFGRVVATFQPGKVAELATLIEAALQNPQRWSTGGWLDDQLPDVFREDVIVDQYRRALQP